MQRTADPTPVQGTCLCNDLVRIEILPGLHLGFAHRNMLETGARHRFTGGVPMAYGLDDVRCRQGVELLCPSRRTHPMLPLVDVSRPCHEDVTLPTTGDRQRMARDVAGLVGDQE